MRLPAWFTTALIFTGVVLAAAVVQLVAILSEGRQLLSLSTPPEPFLKLLWPPAVVAFLFGALSGGLFARTVRLRWGFLYAAILGWLVVYLAGFPVTVLTFPALSEIAFAQNFITFNENAATVDVGIAELSGRVRRPPSSYFTELIGPLTGVSVWALLRRRHCPDAST